MKNYDSYIDELLEPDYKKSVLSSPATNPQINTCTPMDDSDELPKDSANPAELQDERPPPVNGRAEQPTEERSQRSQKSDTPAKRIFRVISTILFWTLCASLVFGSLIFAFGNDTNKSYFGYRIYNVLTDSMTPKEDGSSLPGGFKRGTMIIIEMCKPEDIKVGDIITFNPGTGDDDSTLYLTHRVVEIKTELGGNEGIFFVTRGDSNDSDDAPISGSMMIGKKIFHIPYAGSALQWIKENYVLAIVILISFFISISLFRWYFTKPDEEKQNR